MPASVSNGIDLFNISSLLTLMLPVVIFHRSQKNLCIPPLHKQAVAVDINNHTIGTARMRRVATRP
jgi:hypothetical protein